MSEFEPDLDPGEERLREVCEEVSAWLEKWCSPQTQVTWYDSLAVNMTVLIRSAVANPNQAGTIQAANEFLHILIQRLAEEHKGLKREPPLPKVVLTARFAAERARGFDPPADLFTFAKAIHLTYEQFVNPDYL